MHVAFHGNLLGAPRAALETATCQGLREVYAGRFPTKAILCHPPGVRVLGLYLTSVLIWGSTWLAITFQFGTVPPAVSVVYRFALAGLILLAWALMKGLRLRFSASEHLWMALQGFLLFGLNYMCVYFAETEITSGLVAVVFSLLVLFNIVGTRFFFGTPLKPSAMLGAVLGIGGIVLVALVGAFLPVPMAFDVAIAYIAMTHGAPMPYVVAILCTLGIISVFSLSALGKTISWRLAGAAYATVAALGIVAGMIARGW